VINLWMTGIIGQLAWHPSIKLQECDIEYRCRPHQKNLLLSVCTMYHPYVQFCPIQHTLVQTLMLMDITSRAHM